MSRKLAQIALAERREREGRCAKCEIVVAGTGDILCPYHREANRKASARHNEKRRVRRVTEGKCESCGAPTVPMHSRCATHLKKARAYAQARRLAKPDGQCAECKADALAEHKLCEMHLVKRRERQRVLRKTKRMLQEKGKADAVSGQVS